MYRNQDLLAADSLSRMLFLFLYCKIPTCITATKNIKQKLLSWRLKGAFFQNGLAWFHMPVSWKVNFDIVFTFVVTIQDTGSVRVFQSIFGLLQLTDVDRGMFHGHGHVTRAWRERWVSAFVPTKTKR